MQKGNRIYTQIKAEKFKKLAQLSVESRSSWDGKKQIYHKIAEEQLYYDTSVNIPGRCMQVEEKIIKIQLRS